MTKKKKDTMTSIAIGGIMANTMVGSMPSTPGDAGIRTGFATGMSNVGTALPVMGKVQGTRMVLNSVSRLQRHKFIKSKKRR